ncbi:dynein regulatory complex subunit 4-like [Anguilla anguilla]|uniref:dynein regulatory complex subunit 4-like n=1 Tax=Anguilla anguilla TaxID=7936 RepID=UPI0015AFD80D|nr:dynein regulatory complex subunit 4-like [Anguilla anguilla]
MPPKKKGRKKSAKVKTAPQVADGQPKEHMSKEQLEEHNARLQEQLDKEREERNYFQLERDKIHTFWEVTKRQLEEKKADLRNRDREMEESEERHQLEIKAYKQKVKHLLYEHQGTVTEQKAKVVVTTKLMQKDHAEVEDELRKGMRYLKLDIKQRELSNEDLLKSLSLKQDEEITKMRQDFENKVQDIEKKCDEKLQALRHDLDLRRKMEIHEIEERKNSQINTLMKNHEKAFSNIKIYYNKTTFNNLALINSLKEQLEEKKKKDDRLEKRMAEILQQNKTLTEPLQKAKEEVIELQRQMANYKNDKASLATAKARLKAAEKEMKRLKWEHEVLEQRFSKVQEEKDELYQKFTKAILEVQQKSGFKNLLLEKKLSALTETLEK